MFELHVNQMKFNFELTIFELTMFDLHVNQMKFNFELTVFELTMFELPVHFKHEIIGNNFTEISN